MNANELFNKIIESGADEKGIRDRFGGNIELYETCFLEFMEEPNFALLKDAVDSQSYERAFEAAHALKGLSGNLGVNGFYDAIRTLTNSLRHAPYVNIAKQYEEVERQYERLRRIMSDEPTPENTVSEALPPAQQKQKHRLALPFRDKSKNLRLFVHLLCATVAFIAVVVVLLFSAYASHGRRVTEESGRHLIEITNQVRLYIEENIATDWKIAQSVGDSILDAVNTADDNAVFNILQNKKNVWGVSDLMLYTENGRCIYADGSTETTDVASGIVYYARKHGKYMSIIDSRLIYTVPLNTGLTFGNSEIVAVSVVREMSSFLEKDDFSSFDGAANVYLAGDDGIVISSLSSPSEAQAFNIQSLTRGMRIKPLGSDHEPSDFLSCRDTAVFTLSGASGESYGVSAVVMTDSVPMKLFYFVPTNVVNEVMSGFSTQLILISIVIIALFAACVFSAFMYVYRNRKKAFDKAILNRQRMFDLLVKNTGTAFGLFAVNHSYPEYVSANATDVTGEPYWILSKSDEGFYIHNEKNIETDNIFRLNESLKQWDGKRTFRSEYLRNADSATPSYFMFELYPVNDGEDDFVGIAQDVTQIYAREEAVKSAMESAKQANEAKTRFLSNISHDIRTPMNAIINMSNFSLENIDNPKKLGGYLHVIHESAGHLLHLINDVLDMTRIESGQLVVSSAPFDIEDVIRRQAEIVRPMCKAKGQTFITDFGGLGKALVCGDSLKLSQIVSNLLSNAMKFTPEKGAVRFTAKQIPSLRENIVTVLINVEDNGIGISASDIKHIFEPFSRSNDMAVSAIEGTGLGLAIVKNYIDAMGGSIRCESEFGEGSVFTVELFFEKAETLADLGNPNAALTHDFFLGMHALVAEDNHTNRLIAKELLERMGFIVDFAEDGSMALQIFRDSKPDTYDVIYMDIQMPVMDGYTSAARIRDCSHPQAKTIPIIAMTANAFTEDIEKARVAGMDGFVDKPIVSFKLAEQTRKAISAKTASVPEERNGH